MKLIEKLETLYNYYVINRRVGHSTLLKTGTKNYEKDFFVLTQHMDDFSHLELQQSQVVSWRGLTKLIGSNNPLIPDNSAMIVILRDVIEEINRLDEENKKLSTKIAMINQILRQEL